MWVQAAYFVVSLVLTYALAPKPDKPKPASLKDIEAPTAEVGREIPVLFGTRKISGPNVVWYGDLRVTAVKSKSKK